VGVLKWLCYGEGIETRHGFFPIRLIKAGQNRRNAPGCSSAARKLLSVPVDAGLNRLKNDSQPGNANCHELTLSPKRWHQPPKSRVPYADKDRRRLAADIKDGNILYRGPGFQYMGLSSGISSTTKVIDRMSWLAFERDPETVAYQ
jgi:hypothetical protein